MADISITAPAEEPRLDDNTASYFYDTFDQASPEEQARRAPLLMRYADQKEVEEKQRVESMFEKFYTDQAALDERMNQGAMKAAADVSVDPKAFGVRALHRAFFGNLLKRQPSTIDDTQLDAYMSGFSKATTGKASTSDEEFYQVVKGHYVTKQQREQAALTLRGDIVAGTLEAAATGQPFLPTLTYANWRASLPPEITKGMGDADFLAGTLGDAMKWREEIAPYAGVARTFYNRVIQQTGKAVEGGPVAVTPEEAGQMMDTLANMPAEQQDRIFGAAAILAQRNGLEPKNFFQQLRKFGEQANSAIGRSFSNTYKAADRTQRHLEASGALTTFDLLDASARLQQKLYGLKGGELGPEIREDSQQKLKMLALERKVSAFADGTIDPLKAMSTGTLGWLEQGVYDFGQSAGYTAMAAVSLPLTFAALSSSEFDRVMGENPDADTYGALAFAATTSVANTWLEALKVEALAEKLPGFSDFVKQSLHPKLPAFLRTGARSVGIGAAEFAIEDAQNLVTMFGEQALQVLDTDVKDTKLRDEMAELWQSQGQIAGAMWPFMLLGAGKISYQEMNRGEQYLADKKGMSYLGLGPEAIDRITAEDSAEARQTVLQDEYGKLTTEEKRRGLEQLKADTKAAQADQLSGERPTLEQVLDENDVRQWVVSDPAGNEIFRTPDRQAAEVAYFEASRQAVDARVKAEQEAAASDDGQLQASRDAMGEKLLGNEFNPVEGLVFSDATNLDQQSRDQLTSLQAALDEDARAVGAGQRAGKVRIVAASVADNSPEGLASAEFIRGFEGLTGKKIQWVDSEGDPGFAGIIDTHRPNTIYLHARGGRAIPALVGHEWGHSLKKQDPDLYRELQLKLLPLVDNWRNRAKTLEGYYPRKVRSEELTNNIIGDAFGHREFWKHLAEKDKPLLQKVVESVRRWFAAIINKARGSEWGTESFIQKLDEAHAAVMDTFSQAVKKGPYSELGGATDAELAFARPPRKVDRQAEIEAEFQKRMKSPDVRLKTFERAQNELSRIMRDNRAALTSLTEKPSRVTDSTAAIAQIDQERAQKIADLNFEEQSAVDKAAQRVLDTNQRKNESDAEYLRRVEAIRKERERGIRAQYNEKRKAVDQEARAASNLANARVNDARNLEDSNRQNQEQRQKLIGSIGELDALLSVFPPEVRGKVGGYATLTKIGNGETALADFFVKRVEMLDRELERVLRREYGAKLQKLFDRAKPKKAKPGEKPQGKAGAGVHALFDRLKAATEMNAAEVAGRIASLQNQITSGELTVEQEADAQLEVGLLALVGDWKNADAERRAIAVKNAEEVFDKGYYQFRIDKALQREEREKSRKRLISDTGKLGGLDERLDKEAQDNGLKGGWKDSLLGLLNFEQAIKFVFGEKSNEANRLVDMERAASNQKQDTVQEKVDAVEELFTTLAGDRFKGEQLRWKLAQPSIEVVLPLNRDTGKTTALSEMRAISATLMWMQEDGRRHMEGQFADDGKVTSKWHYDQAFIDELEASLSPEAKAVRAHILDEYASEWERLNPVYRQLNGLDMPRHKNYSPLTVKPQQASGNLSVDPVTGNTFSSGSTTPSSLLTRGTSTAEPDFRDALQTFIAHTKQMEHWRAYAPFLTEAQSILGNREVGDSVQAKSGEEAVRVLRGWLNMFSQGGNRDAGAFLAINQGLGGIMNRAASMALVGRIGTLAVQSTQLGAALAEMPTGAYVSRLGKLFAGQLGWGEALNSAYIQRRIKELPPVVRQAMEGMKSAKPSMIRHQVAKLGQLIGGTDGLFTAGTYAIVYDYQLSQAKKSGLSGDMAIKFARKAAERSVDRVAQPTRSGARSLFENLSTNPLARLSWAFASEARKNLALMAYASARRPPNEAARAIAYAWVINATVATLIRSFWRDSRDDDDDEWFDEKNWSPKRLALASLTEPIYGIPAIGESLQGLAYRAAGEYHHSGDLLSTLTDTAPVIARLSETLSGERETEQVLRDSETILTAVGLFNGDVAAAASLSHLARDLFGVAKNATPDE